MKNGHGDTDAGVYATYAATRPPNLFRRSAATFCRIGFHDLAAARRYTLAAVLTRSVITPRIFRRGYATMFTQTREINTIHYISSKMYFSLYEI